MLPITEDRTFNTQLVLDHLNKFLCDKKLETYKYVIHSSISCGKNLTAFVEWFLGNFI